MVDTAVSQELRDSLGDGATSRLSGLFLDNGRHIESRITPAFVYNTVDNPYTPRSGRRLTVNMPVAGGILGGTTSYIRPEAEAILYFPHTRRTALGVRLNAGCCGPTAARATCPTTCATSWAASTRSAASSCARSVRWTTTSASSAATSSCCSTPSTTSTCSGRSGPCCSTTPARPSPRRERIDLRQLRTSSGVELRVIVPMLNVPFRLIYAWNVYRDTFQPARALKFAVGTTF